jgi:uncharacterized protein
MLRTSGYTIYVDLPNNGNKLLVHGYTGAYDKVSHGVANYLRSLESVYPPQPLYGEWSPNAPITGEIVPPSEEAIKVLKRRGYLTEKTITEEEFIFKKIVGIIQKRTKHSAPSYIFMPTYNCNLRCPYCYQDHMRSDPKVKHLPSTIMQPELVDRVFEAMPKIEAQHEAPEGAESPLSIGFYGGEPLLEQNHSIVEYIVNKALARGGTSFSAVTNGTELSAYRDLLGPDKIATLQITLDGPPHEHDKRRIYADGSGSFERIAQNITLALDLGVRVSVRMNIDRNNIHQLPELAEEIVAQGWDDYEMFSAYTSPINAANEKTDSKTTMSSWRLDKILTEMIQQNSNMLVVQRPDDGLKDQIWQIFDQQSNPIPNFKASFCGAHSNMYIVDPFGDLYACWERTGDPNIRIGHITDEGDVVMSSELEQTWRSRTVLSNPACRKCRYALYCGGGCAARASDRNDGFFTNYCDGFAARFRDSTAEAYLKFTAGEEHAVQQSQSCEV